MSRIDTPPEPTAEKSKLPPREVQKKPRELFLDPTYYRLAFQLAAQRANRMSGQRQASFAERSLATKDALELADNVQKTLAWIRWMEENSMWQWHRLLTPKERRLQRFLLATVRPSAELVVAGLQLYSGEMEAAEQRARRLLGWRGVAVIRAPVTRWARVEVIPWSARALYSLACFEAAYADLSGVFRSRLHQELMAETGREAREKSDEEQVVVIWALRQAFRVAHGRQRRELVRWAQDDPALRPVHQHKRIMRDFNALVTRYLIVTPVAADAAAQPAKRGKKRPKR